MRKILSVLLFASMLLSCDEEEKELGLIGFYYAGPLGTKPGDNIPYSFEFRIIKSGSKYMVSDFKAVTGITDLPIIWNPADMEVHPTNNNRTVSFIIEEADYRFYLLNFTNVTDEYSAGIAEFTSTHLILGKGEMRFTRM